MANHNGTASARTSSASALITKSASPQEVTRHIKPDVTAMLWGRAAGRCEFWGCNELLSKSLVTQEAVNRAQRAHIYSFSDDGPRGNKGIAQEKLNDIENLFLVCHGCHITIDKHKDGGRYTVALLQEWKATHERRVEIVTGIDPSKKSHIVLYGTNVGDQNATLNFNDAAQALFPVCHPADGRAIELGMKDSSCMDRSPAFWQLEAQHLANQYYRRVQERIAAREITHVSIFAIAPQPLLILLGTLMTDIPTAEVYQRHREPPTWNWPDTAPPITFDVREPDSVTGTPALVLALSADVTDDRISAVLGDNVSTWRVSVKNPNTDLIKSPEHLSAFRSTLRPLLDRIKAVHGQTTTLHVFPVVGVSAAIEFGRVRMPKAHMPWQLYDQVNARGGFVPALLLSSGDHS